MCVFMCPYVKHSYIRSWEESKWEAGMQAEFHVEFTLYREVKRLRKLGDGLIQM